MMTDTMIPCVDRIGKHQSSLAPTLFMLSIDTYQGIPNGSYMASFTNVTLGRVTKNTAKRNMQHPVCGSALSNFLWNVVFFFFW